MNNFKNNIKCEIQQQTNVQLRNCVVDQVHKQIFTGIYFDSELWRQVMNIVVNKLWLD